MSKEINILKTETLSQDYYHLKKITWQYRNRKAQLQTQSHEVFDRGNGAAILLYNKATKNVILTEQFRMPTYVNGNSTGMLIEVCAGMLDNEDAEAGIIRETAEETGYQIAAARLVFTAYLSPGAVTELLHFFVAPYSEEMKVGEGGGLEAEQEEIRVFEIAFEKALAMIFSGEIKDAKTIMLLLYASHEKLL